MNLGENVNFCVSGLPGRQPTGDVSHKPSRRLPLLSARPRLPSQIQSVTALGWYKFLPLGENRHVHE